MLTYLVYACNFRKEPSKELLPDEIVWIDIVTMPHLITIDPQKSCDHAVEVFFTRIANPLFHSMIVLRGEQEMPHDRIFDAVQEGEDSPYLMFHIRRRSNNGWSAMVWNKDYARLIDQTKLCVLAKERKGDLVWQKV